MTKQINLEKVTYRIMKESDMDAIVKIDRKITGENRTDYYEMKISQHLDEKHNIIISLVAEHEGKVVGFIMGGVYKGEFGIPDTTAYLDTLGIEPAHQKSGLGYAMMHRFLDNLRTANIQKLSTFVNWNDWALLKFFNKTGFKPANTLNLQLEL